MFAYFKQHQHNLFAFTPCCFVFSTMNLFEDAAVAAPMADAGAQKEKRIMLKNCDHVASKAFDPFGISLIEDVALKTLAEISEKGDKYAKFYSEFYATEQSGGPYRQGVALSRFAGLNVVAIQQLRENLNFRRCLNPAVLAKAEEEAVRLEPHFVVLNVGKGGQDKGEERTESFGSVKRRRVEGPPVVVPTRDAIQEAAKAVFDWLKLGELSNYRMMLNFLSTGGIFYAFQAADKNARAWVETKAVTPERFAAIALARRQEAAPARASAVKKEEARGGLFDA